jgi:hypothetical protein
MDMNSKYPNGLGGPGGVPENAGDWAYQSLPVSVPSDGVYKFDFGPLAPDFDYPKSPAGVAFDYHLPDFPGVIDPAGDLTIVVLSGQRYLEVPFRIRGLSNPCDGLTLWTY